MGSLSSAKGRERTKNGTPHECLGQQSSQRTKLVQSGSPATKLVFGGESGTSIQRDFPRGAIVYEVGGGGGAPHEGGPRVELGIGGSGGEVEVARLGGHVGHDSSLPLHRLHRRVRSAPGAQAAQQD